MPWLSSLIGGIGGPGPSAPPLGPQRPPDPRSAQLAGLFGQQSGMMPMARQPGSLRRMGPSPMAMNPRVQAPGSAGLFDQYMQGGMMPRYQPPDIAGIFGDTGRGYRGFLGPQMPKLVAPQAPVIPDWMAGLFPPNAGAGGTNSNGPGGAGGIGDGGNSAGTSGDAGSGSSAGDAPGGGDGVGAGWARGGLVTQDRLIGPNPPGPDDGYGALDAGEIVIPKDMVAGLLAQVGPEVAQARKSNLPKPERFRELEEPAGLLPIPTNQSKFTAGGSRPPLSAEAKAREKALRDKLKRGG